MQPFLDSTRLVYLHEQQLHSYRQSHEAESSNSPLASEHRPADNTRAMQARSSWLAPGLAAQVRLLLLVLFVASLAGKSCLQSLLPRSRFGLDSQSRLRRRGLPLQRELLGGHLSESHGRRPRRGSGFAIACRFSLLGWRWTCCPRGLSGGHLSKGGRNVGRSVRLLRIQRRIGLRWRFLRVGGRGGLGTGAHSGSLREIR